MALDHAPVFKVPTASDAALSEVVRRLVEAYRPERIYLFGSVARGDAGPDSDYDIMVGTRYRHGQCQSRPADRGAGAGVVGGEYRTVMVLFPTHAGTKPQEKGPT
jgi:hypothetical protein